MVLVSLVIIIESSSRKGVASLYCKFLNIRRSSQQRLESAHRWLVLGGCSHSDGRVQAVEGKHTAMACVPLALPF